MTTLVDKLVTAAWEKLSITCFGMDPVPEKMPFEDFDIGKVVTFYDHIFAEMNGQRIFPGAFKPNEGFYSRHDAHLGIWTFDGSRMLKRLIDNAKQLNVPVILDAKRGDIGKSSENYAAEAFEVFGADAVTISPYMGTDSVEPFLKKGAAYVLCRTSNPGGKDLQNLMVMPIDGARPEPLYMHVAHKIMDWHSISPGNVGAVVGATNIEELTNIARAFALSDKQIPLLIPGVGKQGGSAKEVMAALKEVGYNLDIVRINSSSELNFAWEKEGKKEDYAGAAVRAMDKLNKEISYAPRKI